MYEKKCFKCMGDILNDKSWYGLHVQWFNLSSLELFQNILSRRQSDSINNKSINSSFFHGKFRKYSSILGSKKYILKVEENDYQELSATEYLCNQILKLLKVNVAPFYLINFEEKHSCFATENFMQNYKGSSLVHLYHFFKKNLHYNCKNILKIIELRIFSRESHH